MNHEIVDAVKVGIADLNIVRSPQLIRTAGLGSCVGLVLFDRLTKIAGMAHIMLPDSTVGTRDQINYAKYADTAVPILINKLAEAGARVHFLQAKIAGGAQMFQFQGPSDIMRIGPRNIEAVKKQLVALNIPLTAEDVGGTSGRTIEFDPVTCELMIRTVNKGTKVI